MPDDKTNQPVNPWKLVGWLICLLVVALVIYKVATHKGGLTMSIFDAAVKKADG